MHTHASESHKPASLYASPKELVREPAVVDEELTTRVPERGQLERLPALREPRCVQTGGRTPAGQEEPRQSWA